MGTTVAREADLAAVRRALQALVAGGGSPSAVRRVVRTLTDVLHADRVTLLAPDESAGEAIGVQPLRVGGQLLGSLAVFRATVLSEAEREQFAAVADALALALWGVAGHARAYHLATQLLTAVEEERSSLAGELHDGVLQSMVAARYAVDLMDGGAPNVQMPMAREAVQGAVTEARRELWHLRSRVGGTTGLREALVALSEYLADSDGPTLTVRASELPAALSPLAGTAAYRLVQEAVRAAVRRGGATRADVGVAVQHDTLVVEVHDNGTGYTDEAAEGGSLSRWCERIRLLSGHVEVQAGPEGSTLVAQIPHAIESARATTGSAP